MLHSTAKILLGILLVVLVLSQTHRHTAASLREESAFSFNELGLRYVNSPEAGKAIQAFRDAIAIDPTVAEYHFNLAFMYENSPEIGARLSGMNQQQLFKAILDESLKARSLKPEDLQMAKTYAWYCLVFDKFGASSDWDRTLEAWQYCLHLRERACEANPTRSNHEVRVHPLLGIARILLELNRNEEAREHIDEALSLFPQSRLAQILLARCQMARGPRTGS